MSELESHSFAGSMDQWRQTSFIFFDLGAMNLIAGAGAGFFFSLPLQVMGFGTNSFWLGIFFILVGLVSWKARRLPILVPLVVIAVDLWNTISILPLYSRATYVVLVQISFVIPLAFMLVLMVRGRLKGKASAPSAPLLVANRKEALALLSSMLVSVGLGLGGLVLFSNYLLQRIAEATNPLINIFHDLFLVPALLLLFPIGTAVGELIWITASRFYLRSYEVAAFIRYLRLIPLVSRILPQPVNPAPAGPASNFATAFHFKRDHGVVPTRFRESATRHIAAPGYLVWLASIVVLFVGGIAFVASIGRSNLHTETSEETPAEPGTIVVSLSGSSQYRNINDALAKAASGAQILIRPGVYRENVLIDKSVILTGDERGGAVIECAAGDCVKVTADQATIRNLTVRAHLGWWARLFGHEEPTAMMLLNGHSVVENCDLSSNAGVGIVVSGSVAEPEMRNVRVHDCRLSGILFTDGSRGLIDSSEIYNNRWAGIRSEGKSQPVVRRSRIHHGRMDGVLIADQGTGTFEECEIFENNYSGVQVKEGSSVTLSHCRVFKQTRGGIFLHDRSSGTVDECDINGNGYSGIEVADQAAVQVNKSTIHHGETTGIIVWRQAIATVENSSIFDNKSTGLLVSSGGKPFVRKCLFRGHLYSAVEVKEGGEPVLQECQIYGGQSSGIYFHDGGNGIVQDCSIFGNGAANVVIASGSNPQLKNSRISESRQAGLLVTSGGKGKIENCKIFNNLIGVEIKEYSAPLLQACRISDNRQEGVSVDGMSGGSITDSELAGNAGGAFRIDSGSRFVRD